MSLPKILLAIPVEDFMPRARAFADCVEALVDEASRYLPEASAARHHAYVVRNWPYLYNTNHGEVPLWDMIELYHQAKLVGVPSEQLDALVALHLT